MYLHPGLVIYPRIHYVLQENSDSCLLIIVVLRYLKHINIAFEVGTLEYRINRVCVGINFGVLRPVFGSKINS